MTPEGSPIIDTGLFKSSSTPEESPIITKVKKPKFPVSFPSYLFYIASALIKKMADSFSQIYIHLIFAVQWRESLIKSSWEDELYKYTTSRIQSLDQLVIEINGMPDHLHTLIRMKPTCLLSDLVREVKKSTNNFIRDRKFSPFQFAWQEGYGAFSCHQKDVDYVRGYIKNQKVHHQKEPFSKEYPRLLNEAMIPVKERKLFHFFS